MVTKRILLVVCSIFIVCESASIVDTIDKCDVKDQECITKLFRSVIHTVINNGIPELDIPPLDPYVLKNVDVLLLGLLKFTIIDGNVNGFKNCNYDSFKADIINRNATVELVCENNFIEGQYKLEKTSTLEALLGDIDIYGEGKASIKLDKFKANIDFALDVEKLDDNELHLTINSDETDYTFEALEKVAITADSLSIGKQEISEVAVNIFNENWKPLSKIFGRYVIDEALKVFYTETAKFFNKVPMSKLFDGDLSTLS